MMQRVNSVNFHKAGLPYFVTLTYHHRWPEDPRRWKDQLKALRKRIERRWGPVTAFWRLEFQKRGAPHFHLLLWLQDEEKVEVSERWRLDRLRNNISWWWNEIADPGNMDHLAAGTQVAEARNLRHMNGYLSKYVAKLETLQPGQVAPGRLWGVWRQDWLPIHPVAAKIGQNSFVQLRRILARKSRQKIYSPAPRGGTRQIYGMTCFLSSSSSHRLLAWLGIIGTTAG